jgi:hypothetical protein
VTTARRSQRQAQRIAAATATTAASEAIPCITHARGSVARGRVAEHIAGTATVLVDGPPGVVQCGVRLRALLVNLPLRRRSLHLIVASPHRQTRRGQQDPERCYHCQHHLAVVLRCFEVCMIPRSIRNRFLNAGTGPSNMVAAGWSNLTQPQLRALLRSHGQPTDGSEAALAQRVGAFMNDDHDATAGDDDERP